jgi:hypothetical protein
MAETELLAVCVWDGEDAEVKEVYLYPIDMDPDEAERHTIADLVVGLTRTDLPGECPALTVEEAQSFIEGHTDLNTIRTKIDSKWFAAPLSVIQVVGTPSPEMLANKMDPFYDIYDAGKWTVSQAVRHMKNRIAEEMSIPRRSVPDHYTVEGWLVAPRRS